MYPKENGETDECKWGALPVKGRFSEIARVMGHCSLSSSEMFGILSGQNMEYIGIGDEELRSGKGAAHTPDVCIPVPIQKCIDVGTENPMRLQREQTWTREFDRPEYFYSSPRNSVGISGKRNEGQT